MNFNIEFIYNNLDKLFMINFTMLAFMVAALAILQTINSGRIIEFKEVGLFEVVITYFNKALIFHFWSGVVTLFLWFVRLSGIYRHVAALVSFVLFSAALYYTYQSYKFLIYFIKKQKP